MMSKTKTIFLKLLCLFAPLSLMYGCGMMPKTIEFDYTFPGKAYTGPIFTGDLTISIEDFTDDRDVPDKRIGHYEAAGVYGRPCFVENFPEVVTRGFADGLRAMGVEVNEPSAGQKEADLVLRGKIRDFYLSWRKTTRPGSYALRQWRLSSAPLTVEITVVEPKSGANVWRGIKKGEITEEDLSKGAWSYAGRFVKKLAEKNIRTVVLDLINDESFLVSLKEYEK